MVTGRYLDLAQFYLLLEVLPPPLGVAIDGRRLPLGHRHGMHAIRLVKDAQILVTQEDKLFFHLSLYRLAYRVAATEIPAGDLRKQHNTCVKKIATRELLLDKSLMRGHAVPKSEQQSSPADDGQSRFVSRGFSGRAISELREMFASSNSRESISSAEGVRPDSSQNRASSPSTAVNGKLGTELYIDTGPQRGIKVHMKSYAEILASTVIQQHWRARMLQQPNLSEEKVATLNKRVTPLGQLLAARELAWTQSLKEGKKPIIAWLAADDGVDENPKDRGCLPLTSCFRGTKTTPQEDAVPQDDIAVEPIAPNSKEMGPVSGEKSVVREAVVPLS